MGGGCCGQVRAEIQSRTDPSTRGSDPTQTDRASAGIWSKISLPCLLRESVSDFFERVRAEDEGEGSTDEREEEES